MDQRWEPPGLIPTSITLRTLKNSDNMITNSTPYPLSLGLGKVDGTSSLWSRVISNTFH